MQRRRVACSSSLIGVVSKTERLAVRLQQQLCGGRWGCEPMKEQMVTHATSGPWGHFAALHTQLLPARRTCGRWPVQNSIGSEGCITTAVPEERQPWERQQRQQAGELTSGVMQVDVVIQK